MKRLPTLLFCVLAYAAATPLQAQDLSFRVGAGAAFPLGAATQSRHVGPAFTVSAETRMGRHWRLRLDGDVATLTGRATPAGTPYPGLRSLRATGATLSGVRRMGGGDHGAYVLVGLGAYRLGTVGSGRAPRGTTAALQTGMGLEGAGWGRLVPFGEARVVAHATDFGASDFRPLLHLPVTAGFRVR
jgi:hypothetical protein